MASIYDWKPEVGMEVYIVPYDTRSKPRTGTIAKVGRRYFYVGEVCPARYFVDTKHECRGECFSRSSCYRCEADYRRAVELKDKRREIERSAHKLADEQVDAVYEWIKSNNYKK